MRLIFKILAFIIVVLIILTFLPVSVLGTRKYDVEVSARINQAKLIGWIPGFKEYNIDNVNFRVTGDTNFIEWGSLLNILWESGSMRFCIDDVCQTNSETFFISPGEQRTSTETLNGITEGQHTLTITFSIDKVVKDTYSQVINI